MSKELINGNYYLVSVVLIVLAFVVFFFSYEKKKPQARELVTLSVMCAIAVASRAVFSMIPFFKPMAGIIMITGMAFGPGAGFLTGVVSAFVSNFIFGQGPWTPFQMLAWGICGFLAGGFGALLHRKIPLLAFGALSGILFSAVMEVWTVASVYGSFSPSLYLASLTASLPREYISPSLSTECLRKTRSKFK